MWLFKSHSALHFGRGFVFVLSSNEKNNLFTKKTAGNAEILFKFLSAFIREYDACDENVPYLIVSTPPACSDDS